MTWGLTYFDEFTFCGIRFLDANSADVEYCHIKLINAVQALQCIEQHLLYIEPRPHLTLLDNMKTLIVCFVSLKNTWNKMLRNIVQSSVGFEPHRRHCVVSLSKTHLS